jgi:parallel beta-helix repeat protein
MKIIRNKKHKFVTIFLIIILLMGSNFFSILGSSRNISFKKVIIENQKNAAEDLNKTIYVDDNNTHGPWNGTIEHPYQHVQDAINNASNGDIIYVFSGVYNENVTVDKQITLIGQNKTNTIIDGSNLGTVVYVLKDRTTLANFTLRNSGGYKGDSSIRLVSEYNLIKDCIIYRSRTGIYVNGGNNIVKNCIFHTNGEGVFINNSSLDIISDCYFTHNAIGIDIQNASKIEIYNSYAETNGLGLFIDDSSNVNICECAFYNNNDNQGGVFVGKSEYITLTNCNIYHNGFGVRISESSSIWVNKCNITWNTHFAIIMDKESKDIVISRCNISFNFRYAIYIEENSCVNIHNNNIFRNTLYGVFCGSGYFNAQNNWWGSPFGPSLTEVRLGDRITQKNRFNRYMPWKTTPFENVGTNWKLNFPSIEIQSGRFKPIRLGGKDSDKDGVPDWWEVKYGYDPYVWDDHENLDPDKDGLNNIEECYTYKFGSNPFYKDVFLEFDWIAKYPGDTLNKPPLEYIDQMISVFKEHDINLHIDDGRYGGGEEIPYISNFSYADLRDIYWDYFLHNNLNNPRKGIFRYCLVCYYGPGPGFAFIGWNSLDSFDISAQMLQNKQKFLDRGRLIIGGSIHELGHTFGLFVDDHGGIDNMGTTNIFSLQWLKYRNYKSCMNYLYTYRIIDYSDGSHGKGDFDDWNNLDFTFFKNTHFKWPK